MDWINYEEDPSADDVRHWSHGAFHKYWYETFSKKYGRKPRWGIKEVTLLKKLINEYKSTDLKEMMAYSINTSTREFATFYMVAADMYEKIKDWEWN